MSTKANNVNANNQVGVLTVFGFTVAEFLFSRQEAI